MPLTVIQMVDYSLSQAGLDSSFQTQGKLSLKIILESAVRDFNWPFLRTATPVTNLVSGTTSYALPTNYSRSDTCYIYSDGQRGGEIALYDPVTFERIKNTSNSGVPAMAYIDILAQTIVFESAPVNGSYAFQLHYFKKDLDIDVSGNTTDNSVPAFQDQKYLIDKLIETFFEYQDDSRKDGKMQESAAQLGTSKKNVMDTDANSTVILATPAFRPGRRPTRGGGGGAVF